MGQSSDRSSWSGFTKYDVEIWKISCQLASSLCQIANEIDAEELATLARRMKKSALQLPDQFTSMILAESEDEFSDLWDNAYSLVVENSHEVNFLFHEQKISKLRYDATLSFLSHLEGYLKTVTYSRESVKETGK